MRATLRFCLSAGLSATLVLALAGPLPAAEVHYAANPVPDSWLVEIQPGAPMASLAHALAAAHGGQVGSMYRGGFRGFVLRVPDQAIQGLAHHPLIKNLIQDEWYAEGLLSEAAPYCYPRDGDQHMSNDRPLPSVNPATAQIVDCTEPEVGSGGPLCIDNWGLDRVGEERPPSDYRFQWPVNGAPRRIYVFDTGIRDTHREFERDFGQSRVVHLFNATKDEDGDHHGHGTHVAAIAAGRTYGVAKWATLYRVQIVDGDEMSFLSWIMDGLQAIDDHLAANPTEGIAVMNWSGGNNEDWATGDDKQSVALRQKLTDLLEAHPNLLFVQSAGNYHLVLEEEKDACDWSFGDDDLFPTVFDQILVVAGSDPSDERFVGDPWASNFGECVDLFAPAEFVVSAWKSHDSAACQISGTSMAAPHASGTAAVLSQLFPSEDAAGIRDLIVGSATRDVLDPATLEGSPNLLLALPAGDGVIFDDDFAGLGNWPINEVTGQGENAVCSGYCARIESAADTAYLGDTRPDEEYVYRVAFLFSNYYDLTFGADSEVTLFRARGADDAPLFELVLEPGSPGIALGIPRLRVDVYTNDGLVQELVEFPESDPLVDPTLQLEFEWVPSAFDLEPEGFFRLWSGLAALGNVQLQVSLEDLDTHDMTVESALLGIVSASGTVVEGELWFSEFKSRREDLRISF